MPWLSCAKYYMKHCSDYHILEKRTKQIDSFDMDNGIKLR